MTVLVALISIGKGLRHPMSWALTQAMLDYSHGITRRGLLGSLYRTLHLQNRARLEVAMFAELLLFFAALAFLIRRSRLAQRTGSPDVLTVFFGSYAVTYLTHLVGYTDIVNATLAILVLLIRNPIRRGMVAVPVSLIAVLVHESYLVMFLPVILFSLFLNAQESKDSGQRHNLYLLSGLIPILSLVVAIQVASRGRLTLAQSLAWQTEIQQRVNFELFPAFFPILSLTAKEGARAAILVNLHQRIGILRGLILCVPVVLYFCWKAYLVLTRSDKNLPARTAMTAMAIAGLSPMLLNLLGTDVVRWQINMVLCFFLCLCVIPLTLSGSQPKVSEPERNVAILLVVLGAASGGGLLIHSPTHWWPFLPY